MQDQLIDRYKALPNDEQNIMLALAVIYAPITQTRLLELLRESACLLPATIRKVGRPLKQKLQDNGLLVANPAYWRCHQDIAEILMRIAVENESVFKKIALAALEDRQYTYQYALYHELKKFRIYLHLRDEKEFLRKFDYIKYRFYEYVLDMLKIVFFEPYAESWFSQLPDSIKYSVLQTYLHITKYNIDDSELQYQLLDRGFGTSKSQLPEVRHTVIEQRLLRGNRHDADEWLMDDVSSAGLQLLGSCEFLQNHNDAAIELFSVALKQLKKETRKRNICLEGFFGLFYNLALIRRRTPADLAIFRKQLEILSRHKRHDPMFFANSRLQEGLDIYLGKSSVRAAQNLFAVDETEYNRLIHALVLYWLGEVATMLRKDEQFLAELAGYCHHAHQHHYHWYAAVSATLLQKLSYKDEQCQQIAQEYQQSPFIEIVDLLPRLEPWERALEALTKIDGIKSGQGTGPEAADFRMSWLISQEDKALRLEPREQKLGKNGRWSKGRAVALKRLYLDLDEFPYLSEQDKLICAQINFDKEISYYSYRGKEMYTLPENAILTAAGHPHVFWAGRHDGANPVKISTAEPQLLVKEQDAELHISLLPEIEGDEQIYLEKMADDSLLIYSINAQHRQVAAILGKKGLIVPVSARQKVIDSIASIAATLTVQSDIGGQSSKAATVDVDSRLHIHLQPAGSGIQIEFFIQPFTGGGPVFKPGEGGKTVLAEIDGRQLQTTRDFEQELQYVQQTIDACPELYAVTDWNWSFDDADMALEALLQLQALGDFAILEWPKGKKIQISRETGLAQVKFSVRKERDWFSIDGEIQVDDDRVLEMQRLMGLLNSSRGRFLKLEDGQIIALTQELRQRLDDFAGLGDAHQDKIRFHPMAAPALQEITEGMEIKAGKQWQKQMDRFKDMEDLVPELPSTFQGELRDYQLDGFQWMARLAHWGAGACLADDMGLGKTIQALALILSRCNQGAALILAPTSVCMNWQEESQRFAPTLNVQSFGPGDRQQMLDEAGPFDVIICSYGLLQTEAARLAKKQWHTVVADEAQAIKNNLAKRSQAAMALQADFKLITTGTPIENHLGELWNLFNFINPGLLGSLKKFNERFAQAIENNRDHGARKRLKKLLSPFILRRLKSDVLTELPPRTEVMLHVELSSEEKALYEGLRRNAIKSMDAVSGESLQPGHKLVKMLTEIMKLRRACCHPRLVMDDSYLGSAKLQAFTELVEDLISNRHKALVFSQFVGHLSLIRETLDNKGINYQYLDGSTPMAKRKKAINAFQSGVGDLFLISLKAGGSGLNLTAADYVIHMDPWWNPAVEDQASDRAHRMGQKRPVTIYRLVAKDTIEEKIVELHKHKRDLADSLLEGGEISAKMSVDDMLELVRDID